MFSRGLSVAIPTVCFVYLRCFRRNHHRVSTVSPNQCCNADGLMIPDGNIICVGACPWVSLRSTHGYTSDYPLSGKCMYGVWFSGVWDHRVAVGATGRSPATQTKRKRGLSPPGDAATDTSISGRTAGELPLAPTLPAWAIIDNTLKITA